MKTIFSIIVLSIFTYPVLAQDPSFDVQLEQLNEELRLIDQQRELVEQKIEDVKLDRIQNNLTDEVGLPTGAEDLEIVCHKALCLAYDEQHEQARWVAHVISPDIITGKQTRSNDFRRDDKVSTGTAVEADYFLKYLQPDSSYKYDGFGYDRGHLAPSADFRWSASALSESYYYSNMSPQLPEFNREKWAELEGAIRGYIFRNPQSQLYVVTGPIIDENPKVIERGIHQLSIPSFFWKVVVDLNNQKGIGFILPHKNLTGLPLSSFTVSIDQVESTTGLDFFPALSDPLEDSIEGSFNASDWLSTISTGDVEPLYAPSLPANHFNTTQAKRYMGRGDKVSVCGTVAGSRTSRNGNVLLNLDKQYPNQVFTVFIRKENLVNFSYDPEEVFKGKTVCATGEVINLGGKAAMFIEREEQIAEWD
jgi:endonuclease G